MDMTPTKENILDAAEGLFARDGYHSTSLRAITARAGVNLAAVNYHFGSKKALLEAVIDRRLHPLNLERMRRLESVRDQAARENRLPNTREVLRAFFEPTIRFKETGEGAEDFTTIIGRAMAEPDDTIRSLFLERMLPVFKLLFSLVCSAVPSQPRDKIYWRIHFALGAMSHMLCKAHRVNPLPEGVDPQQSTESLIDLFLSFVTAGMESS